MLVSDQALRFWGAMLFEQGYECPPKSRVSSGWLREALEKSNLQWSSNPCRGGNGSSSGSEA